MDFTLHPVSFVGDLVRRSQGPLTLSFSRYFYRPRSALDEREIFEVPGSMISEAWLDEQLSGLREGWDLALNSNVVDARGRTYHIPMVDFVGDAGSFFLDGRCREIVGHRVHDEMLAYSSGRSLHGYSSAFLSPREWVSYMARLLLIDFPGEPELIDHRWIGHRLCARYAALRWSANGAQYLAYPRRLNLAAQLRPAHASRAII